MNIGTAKPSVEDRMQVPHHLIDIRNPEEDFSVVDFQRLAGKAIASINQRGKIPILVGGTGLYVQALLEGYQFNPTPKTDLRTMLVKQAEDPSETILLHQKLTVVDPEAAERIHPNDRKRILRALEVMTLESQTISRRKTSNSPELSFDCLIFGLSLERQELYQRIDARVDHMLEEGLVDEVRALMSSGLTEKSTSLQAIGYKELLAYLNCAISLEAAVSQIKQSSRRYAKRQLTWFRRMPYIQWVLQPEEDEEGENRFRSTARQVAEKFSIK
jgi:tRNA dimethylallyltransferase